MSDGKVFVHVKNNRWTPGGFPNTPEGEEVFTISEDRFNATLASFPTLHGKVEALFDWDVDNFESSMAKADVLLTWDLPMSDLEKVAPSLRWIHCIGAGVEHMLPLDWIPGHTELTNNKGVHSDKAGEYGVMAALMLAQPYPRDHRQSASAKV